MHTAASSKAILASTKLADFISNKEFSLHPDNVKVLTTSDTVAKALDVLGAFNVSSAPVIDSSQEYVGIIDTLDLLSGLIKASYPELLENKFLQHKQHISIQELETLGVEYLSQTISSLLHNGDLWWRGDKQSTLSEVVECGFRVKSAASPNQQPSSPHNKAHHRVTIFDILPGESTPDGPLPTWRISTMISQLDIVRYLAVTTPPNDPILDASISQLGLVDKPVTCVSASTPALSAFVLMHKLRVWGVGVTAGEADAIGTPSGSKVVANLSINDLRGLGPDQFGGLALPVGTYILLKRGKITWEDVLMDTVPEAVKSGHWDDVFRASSSENLLEMPSLVSSSPGSTLREVVLKMVDQGVHRCYVVDEAEDGKVKGVVTPTDVLRLMIS